MFFGGDPFEHFAGMHGGGGPGGGGSRRGGGGGRQAAQDVDTTKLYETLGVSYHLSPVCVCVCVCRRCLFLGKGWRGRRRRCSRRAFRSLSSLNPTDCIHLSLSLSRTPEIPRFSLSKRGIKNNSSSLHNDFRFRRAPTRRRSRRHTASSPCSTTPTVSKYHSLYCLLDSFLDII
jgi:hypothetical protein